MTRRPARGRAVLGIGVVVAALAAGAAPLGAQGVRFGISPPEIELLPAPGGTATAALVVYNKTPTTVRFRVHLADFYLRPSGELDTVDAGKLSWTAAPFTRVLPQEFDLATDRLISLRVAVTVPSGVRGGRYALVVVSANPVVQIPRDRGTFAVVVPQLASKLLVRIRGTEVVDGSIVNMLAAPKPGGRGADVRVVFRNSGNVHVRVKGDVTIVDADERRAANVRVESSLVLPGTVREFRISWTGALAPGTYTVRAVLDYGGDMLVSGEIGLTIRP